MKLFSNNTRISKDNLNNNSCNSIRDNYYHTSKWTKSNNISLQHPTYQVKNGTGWQLQIDMDSKIRNADTLTNKNTIQQLEVPLFIGKSVLTENPNPTPFKIDIETQLRPPTIKRRQKGVDSLVDHDFTKNTFDPVIQRDTRIQDPKHIVPEMVYDNWVRGGDMTRDLIHNPKYLKKIGYQYNGKFWHK